jgi:ubiquinone/menaquinone biosynthesis C-methylase UbiE
MSQQDGHRRPDRGCHGGHPPEHDQHDDGFDWEVLADSLELDAAVTMPIVEQALRSPLIGRVGTVIEVGCGPGVVTVGLARSLPGTRVIAVDRSEPLLVRVRQRAADAGVAGRVDTFVADLEHPVLELGSADLIWASMVLHHVADPAATLGRLRALLRDGGVLVIVEFGAAPTLSVGDPPVVDVTWQRLQVARSAVLHERFGFDPAALDWPSLLTDVGFVDVTDVPVCADHARPLSPQTRAWLIEQVRRGVEDAGDLLTAAALADLADSVRARPDLTLRIERRVLTARWQHP